MQKEAIRPLENMPLTIKRNYCNVLSLIVLADEQLNPLQIVELYRLMAKIKVSSTMRMNLLHDLIERRQRNHETLIQNLLKDVEDQERNILRFSMIKDLIILMRADHYVSEQEKEIFALIEEQLEISPEQRRYFEEEYEIEQEFLKINIENSIMEKVVKEATASALAIGIPLGAIYYSGWFKGLDTLGTASGLRSLGFKKKTREYSMISGVATSIALGVGIYQATKYLFRFNKKRTDTLKNRMKEEVNQIHKRAIQYIIQDMENLHDESVVGNGGVGKRLKTLLEKTLSTLETVGPRVI